MKNIFLSKTTWLAVLMFLINILQFAQTLTLSTEQLELVNSILGIAVFINRHYLPTVTTI